MISPVIDIARESDESAWARVVKIIRISSCTKQTLVEVYGFRERAGLAYETVHAFTADYIGKNAKPDLADDSS